MNGFGVGLDFDPEFVEVDHSGRYGRYNEILGKGASKTVYRGFDEYEGIEVAWNQVKVCDFLQSPEDLERLYCEIHLLKTLKHPNIMKFYTSWVDTAQRNINFVTEMFTSGTLRQFRLKHKRVNIKAIKHWCQQILRGLHYLHSCDPPIIHRDLKCDNIFVNGNQGEVKIGDLGLAAILRKSHADHCVGTPEFMAPEVYEEEYNELVDIYAFGMCILEMVSLEYPYSECSHPAQIYKKVISGKKPDALYKVKDPEVRQFIDKCLASVSDRLSAWELLTDPFLQTVDYVYDSCPSDYRCDYSEMGSVLTHHLHSVHHSSASLFVNGYSNLPGYEQDNDFDGHSVHYTTDELDLFTSQEDKNLENVDVTIEGQKGDNDNIFLRLRIADNEGRVRNIYFPFDVKVDTALNVADEMVSELDITDQDVTKIAEMIDAEIASLVPNWETGGVVGESHSYCQHCATANPLMEYLSSTSPSGKNLQVLQCLNGCGAVHGRFEEITYQFEGSEQCVQNNDAHSTLTENVHFTDIWALHEGCPDSQDNSATKTSGHRTDGHNLHIQNSSMTTASVLAKDYENEIRQEIRWLKAKYQMQLGELRFQRLGVPTISSSQYSYDKECKRVHWTLSSSTQVEERVAFLERQFSGCEYAHNPSGVLNIALGKKLYTGHFLPHSLHRAISLPVDATDM